MVESDLGTMVINESDEEDDGTMKRKFYLQITPFIAISVKTNH